MQAKNAGPEFARGPMILYRNRMTQRLKDARRKAGLTQTVLADLAGTTQPQIMRLETGEREMTVPWARRLAPHLSVAVDWLLELDQPVNIVGYVGAGGQAEFMENGVLGQAPRPPDFGDDGVALQVRGDSMPGIAEDDWLIYYDNRVTEPTDDMIGRLCVVQIEDGRVLVKRLYRAGGVGEFDLISSSPSYEPIRNVRIAWVAKVDWIRPK